IATFAAVLGLTVTLGACDKKEGEVAAPAAEAPAAGEPAAGEPAAAAPAAEEPAAAPAAAVEMAELDITAALTAAGREAETTVVIDAPKGATVKEEFGSVIVEGGDTFALTIGTEAADIAEAKKF